MTACCPACTAIDELRSPRLLASCTDAVLAVCESGESCWMILSIWPATVSFCSSTSRSVGFQSFVCAEAIRLGMVYSFRNFSASEHSTAESAASPKSSIGIGS